MVQQQCYITSYIASYITTVILQHLYYNSYITLSSQRVTDMCYKTLLTLYGNIAWNIHVLVWWDY